MEDLLCSKTVGIDEIKQLKRKACEARAMIIRMVYDGGSGHCGGSLSIVDILSVLYFREMRCPAGTGLSSPKAMPARPSMPSLQCVA